MSTLSGPPGVSQTRPRLAGRVVLLLCLLGSWSQVSTSMPGSGVRGQLDIRDTEGAHCPIDDDVGGCEAIRHVSPTSMNRLRSHRANGAVCRPCRPSSIARGCLLGPLAVRRTAPPGSSVFDSWTEASVVTWICACSTADLVEDAPFGVVVNEISVCLVRTSGQVFAVHDECTHESVRLSEGESYDSVIECWRHGSCFDLRTGAVLNLPALLPVAVYPVREVTNDVQVDIPQA